MNKYYVSLTRDCIGCYIEFEADTEQAVKLHLKKEYFDKKTKTWKLPWCSIYSEKPKAIYSEPIIIKTRYTGPLYERELK